MRLKFYCPYVFLFVLIFAVPSFSATTYNSGSSLSTPSLVFKAWRAGRGEANQTTFITSTETTCQVLASVGYSSNLPRNTTAPIDPATVSWSFTMTHGMSVAEPPGTSWSGSHPSKLLASTSFNVLAKLSVPRHTRTTGCTTDANRASRTPQHREGTPMEITITFTARTTRGQSVSLQKKLKQDEIDQIRQIHVDMDRKIPSRSEFVSDDGEREHYDFGHYEVMLYKDLKGKHQAWTTAINTRERQPNGLSNLSLSDLFLTSGYRDPHHNDYHANATARHGLHQYGLALDVRGRDVDGIAGNDQTKMESAAIAAGAGFTDTYSGSSHVHADWRPSGWPPSGAGSAPSFSLPAQSTDSALTVNNPDTTNNPDTEATRPCGHLVSASGDHSLQASCSVTNNRWQRCTVTNFYACQSHTHTYPTVTIRCPRTFLGHTCSKGGYLTIGNNNHRSRCRLQHWYWDCDPASVEQHKVRTCARCSNTYQNCQGNSNPCISGRGHTETADPPAEAPSTPQPNPSPPSETPPEDSNGNENEEQEREEEDTPPARPTAVCGSGHTYFTDVSYARSRHRERTCLRCSLTYQNCSNHGTACQNRHWHTEDATAYMTGACGHSHRINEQSQHALVTCSTTNANGDTCTGGSYYACQSHTHTYPAPTTPTPPPSPPENSNPNNNENEEEEAEVPAAPPAPPVSYHPCGEHVTTVSGDHTLQASCSTDATCTATGFYQCQHTAHEYPAPPVRPTAVCGSGHTYFTDRTSDVNRHKDQTCLRCGQTYQNCSNTASACQNRRWHTQDATAYMTGACGHSHRINEKSQHASVTCSTTNAKGDTCTGGSYYACQSHTHSYPAPTPPPSPPENSNPNNNENEEDDDEEEVPSAPPAPTISYHPCGIHATTVSGVHSLQASCSETNSRGDRCTATSFYKCQHSSHTYPAPPPTPTPTPAPTPTVVCPANSWTNCGGTTSHASTCSGGHSYYTCGTANAWHQNRTCTRCSQTYQNCSNSATACQSSKWHTETPQVVLVACGAASWTGCTSQLTSSTAHQVTCSGGHSYWTCGTAVAWHKDRTCSRCRQTYQNCGNSATACQGSRWHRE